MTWPQWIHWMTWFIRKSFKRQWHSRKLVGCKIGSNEYAKHIREVIKNGRVTKFVP